MRAIAAAALDVHREHHIRAEGADEPHQVADNLLAAPFLDDLLRIERIAVVDGAGEVLFGAIEAVRRQQFGRAQHRHILKQLRPYLVLPAVAARRLQVDGTQAHAVREHGEECIGLIVGVRRDLHEGARDAQLAQRQPQRNVAARLRDQRKGHAVLRLDAQIGRRDREQDEDEGERAFHEC